MSAIAAWVERQHPQRLVQVFAVSRVLAGVAVLVAPQRATERFFRAPVPSAEAVTALRMLAGREIALGLGALLATRRRPEAARGWLEIGSVVESGDAYAFATDRGLRPLFRYPFAAIAGASAVLEMVLARRMGGVAGRRTASRLQG